MCDKVELLNHFSLHEQWQKILDDLSPPEFGTVRILYDIYFWKFFPVLKKPE